MHHRHPGFSEALESLHFMVISRTNHHRSLQRSPHMISSQSLDDREELAELYLRATTRHPSFCKYRGHALWWLRQFKAATTFFEQPLRDSPNRDEDVHDASCGDCRVEPLTGIRYRCKLCFNYDICQGCLLRHSPNSEHDFQPIFWTPPKQTSIIQPLLPPNTALTTSIFTLVC